MRIALTPRVREVETGGMGIFCAADAFMQPLQQVLEHLPEGTEKAVIVSCDNNPYFLQNVTLRSDEIDIGMKEIGKAVGAHILSDPDRPEKTGVSPRAARTVTTPSRNTERLFHQLQTSQRAGRVPVGGIDITGHGDMLPVSVVDVVGHDVHPQNRADLRVRMENGERKSHFQHISILPHACRGGNLFFNARTHQTAKRSGLQLNASLAGTVGRGHQQEDFMFGE